MESALIGKYSVIIDLHKADLSNKEIFTRKLILEFKASNNKGSSLPQKPSGSLIRYLKGYANFIGGNCRLNIRT